MENHIFEIIVAIIGGLLGVVNGLFWKYQKGIEKRLDGMDEHNKEQDKKVEKVQFNYINRFQSLERLVISKNENVIEAIGKLKDDLGAKFISKDFCQYIQEQKPK